jgi:RNA polymerase sigma-70 factor (ECF subfamily)
MERPDDREQDTAAPSAIEPLLLPLLPRAYAFALRLTRNAHDAEDLLQEAAERACRFFHQFRTGTNFQAWFFRIVANAFYSRVRRDGRRGDEVSLDDPPPIYLYTRTAEAGLHEGDPDPAATFLARVDTEQVTRALDQLPEEYRAVATLYFIEDLTYEEIADILGVPIGTVRSRLHRGRRLLQRQLWHVAREYGIVPDTAGGA